MQPGTYVSMLEDKVLSWSVTGQNRDEVYISDNDNDDYPSLRSELTKQKASYDFYQRRDRDGDNLYWQHGRDGEKEVSNYGNSPFKPLHECDL